MPWAELPASLNRSIPRANADARPSGWSSMPRVYFLQPWYGLAAAAREDALNDRQAMQGFASIDLAAEGVADATTLLKFRRLCEAHDLCKGRFAAINADLTASWPALAHRHTGGRHADRRAVLHQEPRKATRPGNAPDQAKAAVRAFVEQPFHVVKNIFRHRKVPIGDWPRTGISSTHSLAWPMW